MEDSTEFSNVEIPLGMCETYSITDVFEVIDTEFFYSRSSNGERSVGIERNVFSVMIKV